MRRVAFLLAPLAFAVGLVLPSAPALADTESCASRGEYDNLVRGLTVNQVFNRFDIYGSYLDDNADHFRREYRSCWAPSERRIIIEFSYDTGETQDWYVRDV